MGTGNLGPETQCKNLINFIFHKKVMLSESWVGQPSPACNTPPRQATPRQVMLRQVMPRQAMLREVNPGRLHLDRPCTGRAGPGKPHLG